MPKTINLDINPNTFLLPVTEFLSTWQARSTEETRYYLRGVYCEHDAHNATHNLVATDGHLLIRHQIDADGVHIGANVATQRDAENAGFILDLDPTEKAFKAKGRGALWMHGDIETGILQVTDTDPTEDSAERVGVCEFSRIDGTFPDYRRVIPTEGEQDSFGLDLAILERVKKALVPFTSSKLVPAKFESTGSGSPIRITSPSVPGFLAVQMPVRV